MILDAMQFLGVIESQIPGSLVRRGGVLWVSELNIHVLCARVGLIFCGYVEGRDAIEVFPL